MQKININKLKQLIAELNQEEKIWVNGYLSGILSDNNLSFDIQESIKTKTKIKVFYGTETGNSKQVAELIAKNLNSANYLAKTQDLEIYKAKKLVKEDQAIFIISTHGDGEFPEAAQGFFKKLSSNAFDLTKLNYAVIALGDSSYPLFCQAGADLDKRLLKLGAKSLIERVDLDIDYEDHLTNWVERFLNKHDKILATNLTQSIKVKSNKNQIFHGEITSNFILNDKGSESEVRHIEIMPDEEVDYLPGDAISIALTNDDDHVKNFNKKFDKIAPRLYSIASSKDYHDGEIHLTVKLVKYKDADKNEQKGLCSSFLASLEEGQRISFTIKPNDKFRLPDHNHTKDIILIGPGTGIAPFRSFLADRLANSAKGRNWLFFGNPYFKTDFLYQTEIQEFVKNGLLDKVSLAFSRDQSEKIYVQHRILQQADEVYQWLESGANIYICGDKNYMAKDVENALLEVISQKANLSQEEASDYLYQLKQENRYLKDVY